MSQYGVIISVKINDSSFLRMGKHRWNSELKHEVKFVCKSEIIAVCLLILIAFLWSGISLGWADLLHGVSLQTRTSVTLRDFTIMSGYSMQTQPLPSTKLPKLLFANYPTTAQLVNRLAAVWTDLFCSYWSSSLPEEKLPWRKIDHTSSSSADVKNKWSFTSDPPIRLQSADGDKLYLITFTSSSY